MKKSKKPSCFGTESCGTEQYNGCVGHFYKIPIFEKNNLGLMNPIQQFPEVQ